MKRTLLILAAVALFGGSCAAHDIPPKAATRLENQVSWIRRAAEAGAPQIALARLQTLTETVNQLLDRGRIDESTAAEILGAADNVKAQLALLPRGSVPSSATESFSPSPSGANQGNHGEGNNGNGNGGDED